MAEVTAAGQDRQDGAQVAVTGVSATSAFGRGAQPLLAGALRGQPAFGPVGRFDAGPAGPRRPPSCPELRCSRTNSRP